MGTFIHQVSMHTRCDIFHDLVLLKKDGRNMINALTPDSHDYTQLFKNLVGGLVLSVP